KAVAGLLAPPRLRIASTGLHGSVDLGLGLCPLLGLVLALAELLDGVKALLLVLVQLLVPVLLEGQHRVGERVERKAVVLDVADVIEEEDGQVGVGAAL